ncbi:MAG TPA: sigma-70 family RNA polymerase sigma factor [Micromonosporaceae bacterium]|nr:sigma-70 family RNA polymerase sigma factor [Micromonosporaceae bacterium]
MSAFGLSPGEYGVGWALPGPAAPAPVGARRALSTGLAVLRAVLAEMRALDIGDFRGAQAASVSTTPSKPTQTHGPRGRRPHNNETPSRHQPTLGKPPAGRVAGPGRQTTPDQTSDHLGTSMAAPAAFPVPDIETGPDGTPGGPDDTDPAREAWKLVERAQDGDTEAFGLIYDKYVDTVFRFIYFRVGNRPLAEDLTSESFLRALKRIGTVTWQGRDLGAWLVTIARNLVADHFKSGRYRLEVTTGDVLDADREDRGPEGSPESAVLDHITNRELLAAVKQLNPEQQECIVLRFLHGFSVAETAQAMNKNEGAIKALQYRAVRALNRLLPEGFNQ